MEDPSVYTLATLRCVPGGTAAVTRAVEASMNASSLVGCWTTEIGPLNEVLVLRRFDSPDRMAEHPSTRGAIESHDAAAGRVVEVQEERFASFPGMPVLRSGKFGRFHEVRTYHLRAAPEALPETIAAWQAAVPQRVSLSPLAIVMSALNGPARLVHIWPYESLDQRQSVRAEALRRGLWPPPGTLPWIEKASASICVPADFSPLQ